MTSSSNKDANLLKALRECFDDINDQVAKHDGTWNDEAKRWFWQTIPSYFARAIYQGGKEWNDNARGQVAAKMELMVVKALKIAKDKETKEIGEAEAAYAFMTEQCGQGFDDWCNRLFVPPS